MLNSTLLALLVGLSGLSLIVAVIGLFLGIKAHIAMEAMKQSTHKIQYIDPFAEVDPDFSKQSQENEQMLKKQYKQFNDELISDKSEFSDFDDDFSPIKG